MYVLANMWFQNIMRTFFFSVDKIVFGFISTIYDLLITIARTSVLSQADILDMADRVYKLLAVFMVFKVTFSLIMYVVNPDDFSDKSKGVSKLGMNIVFSLAMLILTPYIFNYAYQLQTIILEDNSLAALVFGDKISNSVENPFNSAGDTMAFITLSPFFTPNLSIVNPECTTLIKKDKSFNEKCSGIEFDGTKFGKPTSNDKTLYFYTKYDNKDNPHFNESDLKNYIVGVSNGSLGMMFRLDMAVATDTGNANFIMEYRYIFSTIVGAVVVLLLLTFCMDVALRSIKLAFLQLIAPIPILSYIDPKSGKDGMFKKWYQMCFKTYLSLFLRLLALYFAVYIISRIDRMVDIVDGSYQTNMFVKIFIIIGALMFAKSFTKILEGLGLKLDGGFTLNPLKKMENEMLGGKRAASFLKAAPAAGLAGAAAFGTNLIAKKGNVFSAAAGALSATGKGLKGALKGEKFGKNFSNSYSGAMKARVNRDDRRELGINAFEVMSENIKKSMYIPNSAQKNKVELDHLKEYTSAGKTVKSRAEGEVDKKAASIVVDGQNLGALRDKYEILKNTQVNRNDYKDKDGVIDEIAYNAAVEAQALAAANANKAYFAARKKAVNAYVHSANDLEQQKIEMKDEKGNVYKVEGFDSVFKGAAKHDEIVSMNIKKMTQMNMDYDMGQNVNTADIGDTIQKAEDSAARIEGSKEYRQSELIAQQAQKEKSSK